jgi:hypothetical protein
VSGASVPSLETTAASLLSNNNNNQRHLRNNAYHHPLVLFGHQRHYLYYRTPQNSSNNHESTPKMFPDEPRAPTKNAYKQVADPSSLSKEDKLSSPAYKTHYPRPLQHDDRAARAAAANAAMAAEKTTFFRFFTPKKSESTEGTTPQTAEKSSEPAIASEIPKVRHRVCFWRRCF